MPQFRVAESVIGRSIAKLALACVVYLGANELALAADHKISPQTAVFRCSSVKPGDTLTLSSGTRAPLTILGCQGTQTNRIIVRNDPNGSGPTLIRRAGGSGGFLLSCNSCVGVNIDGSYKWKGAPAGKTYGIQVSVTGGSGPSAFVKIGGISRFVTIRNVEVDGAWPGTNNGSGIRVNDLSIKRSRHAGQWYEGFLIEDNFIHDVPLSGMYIGPNYNDGALPLRNIEIRGNRVENTGVDGIQLKSAWDGDNQIHHNVVRRAGASTAKPQSSSQYTGIKVTSGSAKIYNNWIEKTGQHGIQSWTHEGPKLSEGRGPFAAYIWNNTIVDAGELWRPFMDKSHGINIGAQNGMEKPHPQVYNNTIVDPRQSGIWVDANVGPGFVRDNIVAGAANPAIKVPSWVKLINNRVGSVGQMGFADPGGMNFHLTIGSPARNQGTPDFPPTDFDDVARPKEGSADQGAFEGS